MFLSILPWILLGILGAPLTLFLHELSHLLVVKYGYGAKIIAFKPWPNPKRDTGKFGVVVYRLPPDIQDAPWSHIAPVFKALGFGLIWGLLSILYLPLLMLMVWEVIDIINWTYHYLRNKDPRQDAYKWRHRE